jgi:hypothetical protein
VVHAHSGLPSERELCDPGDCVARRMAGTSSRRYTGRHIREEAADQPIVIGYRQDSRPSDVVPADRVPCPVRAALCLDEDARSCPTKFGKGRRETYGVSS